MSLVCLLLSFIALSSAIPWKDRSVDCTITSEAQGLQFVNFFISVLKGEDTSLGDPVTTAKAILATDFQTYSDSQLSILGLPLTTVDPQFTQQDYLNTTALKAEFDGVDIVTYGVVASCSSVVWQWEYVNYQSGQYPVKGFHSFIVQPSDSGTPGLLQAVRAAVEFNGLAALLDLGGGIVYPNRTVVMPPH